MQTLSSKTVLLVVDVQAGFDDPAWGARNNPGAEAKVAALLSTWRALGAPVFHVHHNSPDPDGLLRAGTPGVAPKPQATPLPGEPIYRKSVNSAFIGTTLEADLRRAGATGLVICGLTSNHCVSTTARMAGNLGFGTVVVSDATAAFDRKALDGALRPAQAVHDAALSDLQGEFAAITDTAMVIAALTASARRAAHA